jgi:hypothetical protein
MGKSGIHYAKLAESERLQRVYVLLADGGWYGTREIMFAAEVCAVNTVIAELRANGYEIVTRCVGRGRYEYQMVFKGQRSLF